MHVRMSPWNFLRVVELTSTIVSSLSFLLLSVERAPIGFRENEKHEGSEKHRARVLQSWKRSPFVVFVVRGPCLWFWLEPAVFLGHNAPA